MVKNIFFDMAEIFKMADHGGWHFEIKYIFSISLQ